MRGVRAAVLAGLIVVAFGLRVWVDEPGPLFLVPTVLAAVWFGRRAGLLVGVVGGTAYAVAAQLGPMGDVTVTSLAVRTALFGFTGYPVGRLMEERVGLSAQVERRDRLLAELQAIQQALTPSGTPARPGLAIGAAYKPAIEMVAGDFYLVAEGPSPQTTIVAVGDVVGKGVEAARRATFVRTSLSAAAPFVDDPGRLLALANRSVVERAGASSHFVTALCVTYDGAGQSVRWASAGHLPPLRLADGSDLAGATGKPLGIADTLECPVAREPLPPGAGLLLFTDGLVEARRDNGDGRRFGYEGVREVLSRMPGSDPAEISRRLVAAAESFSRSSVSDDICVVALRAAS